MNQTIKYQWSTKLAESALSAYRKEKMGRFSFIVFGSTVLVVVGFTAYTIASRPVALLIGVLGVINVGIQFRIRFADTRLAKDAARLLGDPTVTVTISDEQVMIATDRSTRTIKWSDLTQIVQRENFLLLFAGKLLVASLPCSAFDDAQIAFLRAKGKKT